MRHVVPQSSHRKTICLFVASAIVLTPFYNYRHRSVQAFMPGSISAFFVGGAGNWSHEDITEEAIMPLYNEFFGLQRTTEWHRNAIGEIARFNGQTDLGDEFHYSAPHVDGENFYGAQERLKTYKQKVIELTGGLQASLEFMMPNTS